MKNNHRILAIAVAMSLSFAAHATKPALTNNTAHGGNAAAFGVGHGGDAKATASNTNIIGVASDSKATAKANSSSTSGGNTITVQGYQAARIPVATAYAPPLAASNGTCFGSASGGAQGAGFGVSFGSTVFDESCDARYDSQELYRQGFAQAAMARMCQKPANRDAMEIAGTPCPTKAQTATQGADKPWMTDPLVRAREGLAPL